MHKKIVLCFVIGFFFLNFSFAHAGIFINEVAWMGTTEGANCEWLELHNTGSMSVDLTDWVLYEQGGDVKIIDLSKNIVANGYLLVERVTPTCPDPISGINDISGSFSGSGLINFPSGEYLVLKDKDHNTVQSLDFSGGWPAGDNNTKETMQWNGSSWITATPTPGRANENTNTPPPDNVDTNTNNNENNSGSSSGSAPVPVVIKNPTMKAKIITSTMAFAGQPFKVDADIFGFYNEKIVLGKLYWNFGDGSSFEQINNFEEFYHTYFYPGEYAVSLEYYLRTDSQIPEITNKMIIKVLSTTVTISKVGDAQDFFIELTNNANSDIDVSNWFINANGKVFILPRNSTIMSKKSMTISSRITGFNIGDKYDLKLLSSTGELVFNYNAPSARTVATKTVSTTPISVKNEASLNPNNQLSTLELSANVLESDSSDKSDSNNSYLFSLGLFALLSVSGGAVYFIRRTKTISNPGDDFDILDE